MPFSNRLIFFIFGTLIGVIFIKIIFPAEKISKTKKGYLDYFKGHDKVVNMLVYDSNLEHELLSHLGILRKDIFFYSDLIRNSDIEILSRKPCFHYLLKPSNDYMISELLFEKCGKKISLVRVEVKEND